jgi:3-deoxy-D-manno-octulosonic acid kinase
VDVGAPALEADPVNATPPDRHIFLLPARGGTPALTADHFEPAWWRNQQAEIGRATGRGTVIFVRAPNQAGTWVLRHYLRGGWAAKLSPDRYVWTGLANTRPWREYQLTHDLHERGLPVPRPIGARVIRRGFTYTGDLLTQRIDDAPTLADVLRRGALGQKAWRRLGTTLRQFHDAGVHHEDINVSNVLMQASGAIYVIDFDKARLQPPGAWRERNLARFLRSLEKHARRDSSFAFSAGVWTNLLAGYHASPTG